MAKLKEIEEKKTNQEVICIIEDEGFGYAVHDYISADSIEDKELAEKWKAAKLALDAIEDYLYNE